jgi:hypothetical protein
VCQSGLLESAANLQNHEEKLPKAVCQSGLLESAAKS